MIDIIPKRQTSCIYRMNKYLKVTAFILLFSFFVFPADITIEKIVLEGNERLTTEAFMTLTSLRTGDIYSEARIKEEYSKILNSGLFEDLSIDTTDGPGGGKILTFKIREKPTVASVEFKGSKHLTGSTILDKLKENNADLKSGTVLDYNKIKKTESALHFIAAEKGYPEATVETKINEIGKSQVAVTFVLSDGPKIRIRKVYFKGNHAFSTTRLRFTMKKTRGHWLFSNITKHNILSVGRLEDDMKEIRDLYESKGYLDVDIGDPIEDIKLGGRKKKPIKWVTLTIPINEGSQYRMGKLSFEGNTLFKEEELKKIIIPKEGEILNKVALSEGMRIIQMKYGEKGSIYATATPILKRNEAKTVSDVTVSIQEDEVYYVRRIEFYGNTQTRDKVLRRELKIAEQQKFNYNLYERGLFKLQQLGIFELKDKPTINKVTGTKMVDIDIHGQEANKNELLFGGGFSGINGIFLSISFNTRNFLGLGTLLSFRFDNGKRQTIYNVTYSDPWFFGNRIGFSFSLFNNRLEYLDFNQRSRGGSFSFSFPLGDFAAWTVGYKFEVSRVSGIQSRILNPRYSAFINNTATSQVFGGIGFDRTNHPIRPTAGEAASLNLSFAGGPLGGDNEWGRINLDAVYYWPTFKKQNAAFHLSSGYIKPFGGKDLPLWERFFLGGEQTLRIFSYRSVYPLTKDGRFFIDPKTGTIEGGDRFFFLNNEYVFHIIQQVDVAAFLDLGNTYHERQTVNFSNYRADAGLEFRFFVPMFNAPIRLIWGLNLRKKPDDDTSAFQFSIGQTF